MATFPRLPISARIEPLPPLSPSGVPACGERSTTHLKQLLEAMLSEKPKGNEALGAILGALYAIPGAVPENPAWPTNFYLTTCTTPTTYLYIGNPVKSAPVAPASCPTVCTVTTTSLPDWHILDTGCVPPLNLRNGDYETHCNWGNRPS